MQNLTRPPVTSHSLSRRTRGHANRRRYACSRQEPSDVQLWLYPFTPPHRSAKTGPNRRSTNLFESKLHGLPVLRRTTTTLRIPRPSGHRLSRKHAKPSSNPTWACSAGYSSHHNALITCGLQPKVNLGTNEDMSGNCIFC